MQFHESGLLNDKQVEEAFNYSFANVMSYEKDVMRSFTDQINGVLAQSMQAIDIKKNAGKLSEDQYNQEKIKIEMQHKQHVEAGPKIVERELGNMFKKTRLAPALKLQNNVNTPSPELLATSLLVETVRSPIDYKNVKDKFGEKIATTIAQVHHINAYPSEHTKHLKEANSDTQRIYLSLLINNMDQITRQFKQLAQIGQEKQLVLAPGQEKELFEDIKILWKNDEKLSNVFLQSFNTTFSMIGSPFKIEVNKAGDLQLIKKPTPPAPGKNNNPGNPGNNGGLGGDVF